MQRDVTARVRSHFAVSVDGAVFVPVEFSFTVDVPLCDADDEIERTVARFKDALILHFGHGFVRERQCAITLV